MSGLQKYNGFGDAAQAEWVVSARMTVNSVFSLLQRTPDRRFVKAVAKNCASGLCCGFSLPSK
jgi:hypothetical protein